MEFVTQLGRIWILSYCTKEFLFPVLWFEPTQSPSLMQPLSHPSTSRMKERMGRVKARKLVD